MSDKTECPACGSYTSSITQAFKNGEPCPHCGLSAETALDVIAVAERFGESELAAKYEAAVIRADKAETALAEAEGKLNRVRRFLSGL